MNQPIEKELKILLSEENMNTILKSYDFKNYILQKNTYYDTEESTLKKHKSALRIRTIDNRYIFTLKIQKDEITHFEFEKEINSDQLEKIEDPEILEWMQKYQIPSNLKPIVTFTTKRYTLDLEKAQLCADITAFSNHTDYELEYEYKYEHDGISYFNQILSPLSLRYTKNCPSKIARAFSN